MPGLSLWWIRVFSAALERPERRAHNIARGPLVAHPISSVPCSCPSTSVAGPLDVEDLCSCFPFPLKFITCSIVPFGTPVVGTLSVGRACTNCSRTNLKKKALGNSRRRSQGNCKKVKEWITLKSVLLKSYIVVASENVPLRSSILSFAF